MQPNLYEFQKRQILLIVRVTPYAMVGHLANTAVIAVALAGSVEPVPLIIWCAYSCSAALLLLLRHVRNRGRLPRSFRRAAKKVTIYAIFLALPWSSLGVLYLGGLPEGQELILVALGIGMAACATVLLSAIPPAAFIYMSVILIPTALKCILIGQNSYLLLGTLALSYWGCLAALIAKTGRDLRERHEAELALAERDLQLTLAARAGLVGSYAYDANTETAQISPGYAAIHGLAEGTTEITRSEWLAHVHPQDVERLQVLRSEALGDQREEYNVDYRIVRRDGEVRWIESRGVILYGSKPGARRLIGVKIDVTERKQAEALIKESKTRLADALTAGQVIAFEWDAVTGFARRSDNARDILGADQEGWAGSLGNDFLDHVHPDDRTSLKRRVRELSPQKPSYALTFRYVRPDGQSVWLEETARGEFDAAGVLLRVKGLTRDITERKRTESGLQASEARLAGILEIAGDAIVSIDAKQRITLFNGAAERLFGHSRGEMLGQSIDLLIPARFRAAHQKHIEQFASGSDIARRMGERQEVVGQRKTGEEFPTEASISKLNTSEGWIYTIVLRDVSERKRAEERQRILVAELDHRVKNALATVSSVISHTGIGNRSVTDFVTALEGRIRSMAATHELLGALWWQGVSLTELVRRELAPYAVHNNTEVSGPEVVLRAEAGPAMAMVLHELATNAAKYGALSTKSGRVSVRWGRRLNGHPPRLVLEWREIGGPPVITPGNPSYGTSTICDLIPYEFGGTVDLVFAPEGVQCRLELPTGWLSDAADPGSGSPWVPSKSGTPGAAWP
jgi:PAS domain S-box-containing protein